MKQLLRIVFCMVPIIAFMGCGASVDEQKPPEKAPEMSPEEKQKMESHMQEMQKQYRKKR